MQTGNESFVVGPGETVRAGPAVGRAEGYPVWTPWPINWSAVWVGTLTSLALALIIGLIAVALGAQQVGPNPAIPSWKQVGIGALIFAVAGAFFSFVAGAWVAGRIAGIHHAEHAILQGAIVWLVAIPFLVVLAALGAGTFFGGWYAGLAGAPVWATPAGPAADPNAAAAARNAALAAVGSLLLGLVGSVIGGWMASGEPMHPTYVRGQAPAAGARATTSTSTTSY